MGRLIDLAGQKFSRLVVIQRVKNDKHHNAQWLCRCNCGKKTIIRGYCLKNGCTKSCGCLRKEFARQNNYLHGHSMNGTRSKTYTVWEQMRQRCNDSNASNYKNYGGRGIKVYQRWRSFENFLEDMGERPPGLTLDRIDNNGDYCKENCKWSTHKEQQRNMRNNISITIDGITRCLAEWCEIYNVDYNIVYGRIHRGWTPEEALELVERKKHNG